VGYLQGALSEEVAHANLLLELTVGTTAGKDPVQTFYFPTGTFETLQNFLPILLALENAFIGVYLTAVLVFILMAAKVEPFEREQKDSSEKPYHRKDLAYFSQVAASIMGVESEHRTLARALPAISPGNFSVRIQARSFLLREKFRLYGDAQYFSFFNLRPTGEASRIDLKRTPRRRGCGQRSR
jgi:hypothetical protein